MAEESLRDEELTPGENQPFLQVGQLPGYEPDLEAYKVDEANDPYRRFTESIDAGATIQLSLACADGRRELIELDSTESRAWIRESLEERISFCSRCHRALSRRAA
jgi:hypothetical protein